MLKKTEMMAATKIFESSGLFCVFCISQVVCQGLGCKYPLGMEDGRIKDSQITTTGVAAGTTADGRKARLNKNIQPDGAWCVGTSRGETRYRNYDQFIRIDLQKSTTIAGIATQGQGLGGAAYVKDYKISYSKGTSDWIYYGEEQTPKEILIFQGNNDTSSVVRHVLDLKIITRNIRIHPGYAPGDNACMRLELYRCLVEEVILSYSMPVGQKSKNGRNDYEDESYNGANVNGFYKYGTGILTDGKFGPVNAKQFRGKGWVGWNNSKWEYIDIIFEFSDVRKFKDVTLTVNVDHERHRSAVFNKSEIFFASTKDSFSDTSFLQYCPSGFKAQEDPYNANVSLSLCGNTARFIKLRLYFGRIWLLITEIMFNSDPAVGDVDSSLRSCSEDGCMVATQSSSPTASSLIPVETTFASKACVTPMSTLESEKTLSSVAMFFVGAAVMLFIVLLVLFLIQIYKRVKRRHRASKLPTNGLEIDSVEMQSQTPAEESHNNETSPYEDVHISPSSVYAKLNRSERDATDDDNYQKLLKHHSGDVVPTVYTYPEVYTELNRNERDATDNDNYQKLLKGDVVPSDDQTHGYVDVMD